VEQPAEAARAYAAAQAERPSAYLALRMASALREANQPAQSAAALRGWLERAPDDNEVAMMLSQLDIEAGRLPEAEQGLEALLERRPDDSMALNNLAWLLRLKEEPAAHQRARRLAERGYFLAPGTDVADTLGWILARDGHPAEAVLLLRQSAQMRPLDIVEPAAAYRLAFALNASGARAEALAVLAPVLTVSPAQSFPERQAALLLLAELRRQN
jgi:Flp pilus assembly protein TadD